MNVRFSTRTFWVVWLAILTILGMYSMGSGAWVRAHLPFIKSVTDNRDVISVAPYIYGQTPLVWLGEIMNPDNAYIHLKLRFRTDSTEGNPNVFQTAPVNRGMRMEISGSTAAIVVPDLSVPGGLKGLTLTTELKTGQWYALEIEALNGAFVRVTLDGNQVSDYASAGLSMETSQLLIGRGFDASRTFRGRIENITITKGNIAESSLKEILTDYNETINVAPYVYGKDEPASLGAIKGSDIAYVHLKFRFRADSTEGNPNVFQTAPINRGMRMEISGTTAAIIVPDLLAPGGIKGLTLTDTLKVGQWYSLEIGALNGAFVHATLDELLVIDYASAGLSMETSLLLVGGGFDASRTFRGQIDNISIIKNNRPPLTYESRGIFLYAFYSILVIYPLIFLANFFLLTDFYMGLGTVLFAVTLYSSFYFNSYFPVTEGWFSAYAHLIREGLIPYRDFYLFLTPLYPLQLAAFQSVFGESFIALRILGIFVILLLSLFLYLILARRFSPLVSVIATVTAIIYYQSGVAHIDYDFIQFFNVFVLAATYLIIRYSDNELTGDPGTNQNGISLLFLAGIMVSLAFLTKQSNGTLVVVFSVAATATATAGQNLPYRLRNISVYMLGMFLPVLIMGLWLYCVSALTPFIDQVIFGAIEAKGSIWSILFSWIGRHANKDYLIQLKEALLYMSPLIVLSLTGTALLKWRWSEGKSQSRNVWKFFLFLLLFGIIIGLSYYGSEHPKFWMATPGIKLAQSITAVSTTLAVVLVFFSVMQSLTNFSLCPKDLAISAIMTLGLVFGNGTSAGIGEVSIFLCFALTLTLLMSLPNVYGIAKIVIGVVCLSFILFLTDAKFRQPYAWWYVSEPDVRKSTARSTLPLMAGFRLSPATVKVLEDTTRIIQAHSRLGDDVFTFPNIPGFYVLADRWPHSKVLVSWFDFLPDKFAKAEASRLLASPPTIIANLRLPEAAWVAHESLFREGKPLGQRNIQAAIMELTEQRNLYQLDFSHEVSPGCILEVWHKNK